MKIVKIVSLLCVVCAFLYVGIYAAAHLRGFTDPNLSSRMEVKYAKYSNEQLLNSLTRFGFFLNKYAYYELANRKDLRAVEFALKHLNSWDTNTRENILRRLHSFDTPAVRSALLKIVERGGHDYEWNLALTALARLREEKAWDVIVNLAQAPDGVRNGSVYMIEVFQKPEGLTMLKDMKLSCNAKAESESELRQCKSIDSAIERLEKKQQSHQKQRTKGTVVLAQ